MLFLRVMSGGISRYFWLPVVPLTCTPLFTKSTDYNLIISDLGIAWRSGRDSPNLTIKPFIFNILNKSPLLRA